MTFVERISDWLNENIDPLKFFLRENQISNYYIQGLIISFIIYLFYIELNPGIGGIFIRPDSKGSFRFRISGVFPMLKYPFTSLNFWKPANWDMNFIVFTGFGATLYTGLKYFLNQQSV